MSGFVGSALAFAVAITLLVAVHEFGHYWVARRAGIKVLRFSIGFGTPLWRRDFGRDRTEFVFSAIPLGGYVKMLDEREAPVAPEDRHRSFNQASIPRRMAVLVAGPLANFIFAVLAYWVMYMAGVPGVQPVIGTVTPGSVAASAGLAPEDRVLTVGGRHTETWEGTLLLVLEDMLDDGVISLEVETPGGRIEQVALDVAGRETELTEPGALFPGLGFEPWRPHWPARVEQVEPGGPADQAGLRAGDLVLAADGEPLADWPALANYLRERPNRSVTLEIERAGVTLTAAVDVAAIEQEGREVGRIGIQAAPPPALPASMRAEQSYGPVRALGVAATKTWEMTTLTLNMLWKMVQGVVSPKNISGPINIAQYAGFTASMGFTAFISFLAVVSISLGLINLMPVPMLDGGQIVFQAAELVKGRPLSERAQLIGQQVGLFLLILLMTFAFYNDIMRLLD